MQLGPSREMSDIWSILGTELRHSHYSKQKCLFCCHLFTPESLLTAPPFILVSSLYKQQQQLTHSSSSCSSHSLYRGQYFWNMEPRGDITHPANVCVCVHMKAYVCIWMCCFPHNISKHVCLYMCLYVGRFVCAYVWDNSGPICLRGSEALRSNCYWSVLSALTKRSPRHTHTDTRKRGQISSFSSFFSRQMAS